MSREEAFIRVICCVNPKVPFAQDSSDSFPGEDYFLVSLPSVFHALERQLLFRRLQPSYTSIIW